MRKTMAFILASLRFSISKITPSGTQKLQFRNVGTGALRETASDDRGVFIVTNLLPAKYSVLSEAQGFAKLEQQVDLPPRRQGWTGTEAPGWQGVLALRAYTLLSNLTGASSLDNRYKLRPCAAIGAILNAANQQLGKHDAVKAGRNCSLEI